MSDSKGRKFSFPTERDSFDDGKVEKRINEKLGKQNLRGQQFPPSFKVEQPQTPQYGQQVFNTPKATSSPPVVYRPSGFQETQKIADDILSGNNVIVNLELLLSKDDGKEAMRTIDFLSGLAYGIKIKIEKVSQAVFLFTYESG